MDKAIILSAGQGSRLGHLTDDKPKCLIEFGGRTLLDRQLDMLAANGVGQAVVVTGFRDDQIEVALDRRRSAGEGPTVRTIFNPFFKVADNTGSLFMAREELAGDVLVWNGDTMVSSALMARVGAAWADAQRAPGPVVWLTHAGVIRAATLRARGVTTVQRADQWPVQGPGFGQLVRLQPLPAAPGGSANRAPG